MSKPMKLETFPYVDRWVDSEVTNSRGQIVELSHREKGYEVDGQVTPAAPEENRLTDAELAAEYWQMCGQGRERDISAQEWFTRYDRARTLRSFATLPHHDEDNA